MLALQELGQRLSDLPAQCLKGMALPRELEDAVLLVKTMKSREARRRQIQYIGALMRRVDPEPIRQAFDDLLQVRGRDVRAFQEIERWRDELLSGNPRVIERIAARFPGVDRDRISALVRGARAERTAGGKKHSRSLFRYLREQSGSTGEAPPAGSGDEG